MKIDGELILEFRGCNRETGDVYIHFGTSAERVYTGPAAFALYEMLKQFIRARHAGSGDWFEQDTQHGKQWRERRGDVRYEKLEESA